MTPVESSRKASASLSVPSLPSVERHRLDNGLEVALLDNRQASLVTSAIFYRCGTRDESPHEVGVAHFLEHMMFKGSSQFGPGDVDRLTQELGGSNNAFTSHDVTAYYFQFASDRWRRGLEIEADRMAGLSLLAEEVESERRVILEEIAMYDNDPWSALDQAVTSALFDHHPYGLPVLGTRSSLGAMGRDHLASFHRRHYRPESALLLIAGDFGEGALEHADDTFGALAATPDQVERPPVGAASEISELRRVERRVGSVGRLQLALPAPSASHPDYPLVRVLLAILTWGRSSRLQASLVERDQICVWVMSELREHVGPGMASLALETPGPPAELGGREKVEQALLDQLSSLLEEGVASEELERSKHLLLSDWVFSHERIHQQALSSGLAIALFGPDHTDLMLRRSLEASPEQITEVARRWFDVERGAVLGWSLPEAGTNRESNR